MNDVHEKAFLISSFASDFEQFYPPIQERETDSFSNFISRNSRGIELSKLLDEEQLDPSESDVEIIENTWSNLCSILKVDPNLAYGDIDDAYYETEEHRGDRFEIMIAEKEKNGYYD